MSSTAQTGQRQRDPDWTGLREAAALAAQMLDAPIAFVRFFEPLQTRPDVTHGADPALGPFISAAAERIRTAPEGLLILHGREEGIVPSSGGPAFCAGVSIRSEGGVAIGAVGILDHRMRDASPALMAGLRAFADWTASLAGPDRRLPDQEVFDRLMRHVGQAVIVIDAEGRYRYWNDSAERLYGWRADEVLGLPARERPIHRMPPEQVAEVYATMQEHVRWEGEFLGLRRDGTTFTGFTCNAALPSFADQSMLFVGVSHDLSRLKAAERELEERVESLAEAHRQIEEGARRLAEAQRLARLGSWELRFDDDVACGSVEWSRIHGFDSDQAVPLREIIAAVVPEDRPSFIAHIAHVRGYLQELGASWRLRRSPESRITYVTARSEPLLDGEGRCVGLRGTIQDVTDEREARAELDRIHKMAAAKERLSALGTLVAGVAHEINNPLTYIQGNTEMTILALNGLLENPALDPTLRGSVEEALEQQHAALRGVHQVTRITRSLKQVARTRGSSREPVVISNLLRDVLAVASPRLSADVAVSENLRSEQTILVNGPEVSQVFLNLLLNAAEALADQKDGRIRLISRDMDGAVLVEIEDNGPGIPESVREKVFSPFFTTKSTGTGLGLSISQSIVQEHGGELSFTSLPGKTVFRVRLPAKPQPGGPLREAGRH